MNRRNGPGGSGSTSSRVDPADGHGERRACGRLEVAAADHQHASERRPARPRLDRRVRQAGAVAFADAGGFGRQRPALADVPLGPIDAIPVHLVRPRAADEHRIRQRPPVAQRLAVLDEIDARPHRIDDEPDRRTAAGVPVLHRLQPLVLRRRRQLARDRRHRDRRPTQSAGESRTPAAGPWPAPAAPAPTAPRRPCRRAAGTRAPSRAQRRRSTCRRRARRTSRSRPPRRGRCRTAAARSPATARYAIGTTSGSA